MNKGVILDIGTGDGRFVYQMARKNPEKLYIGIDASSEALVKISEKIHRNAKHGGAPNALFIKAQVENLPEELAHIADEVHIHFPWGSLMKAVLKPEDDVLRSLRRVLKKDALIEIITSVDKKRDASELSRLDVSDTIDVEHVEAVLSPRYKDAGLCITEHGEIPPASWPSLCTSWAAKLKSGGNRTAYYLIAQAI